ncbi:hypothetical protein KVU_2241 [Ketogulonicigenium vulgare WSH-001]|uniref:Uncharacterized protein n=1 Tax=Ketogulonicigenium vulgare (strain WSH-001) TaxID=759362 RepID=F9Y683_KETVW|nr:hypothetical protein KVU_2241 [Ketogulonicigenium vulgare WSH-001]
MPGIDAAADRRNRRRQRIANDDTCFQQLVHRQTQGDPTAGDGRTARAAVGLNHIAVDGDLTLAQGHTIHARTQGAAYKPLNFLGTAGLSVFCLALHPRMGRAGQHAVFCGHPTQPRVLQERRHARVQRCRAQHMRIAHFDQARPFGMPADAGFNRDFTHFIGLAAAGTHGTPHICRSSGGHKPRMPRRQGRLALCLIEFSPRFSHITVRGQRCLIKRYL